MMNLTPGLVAAPGSSTANHTGTWRTSVPRFLQQSCTDCGLCIAYCPEGIVTRTGPKRYTFDADYCKGCAICAEECPADDIVMEVEAG